MDVIMFNELLDSVKEKERKERKGVKEKGAVTNATHSR